MAKSVVSFNNNNSNNLFYLDDLSYEYKKQVGKSNEDIVANNMAKLVKLSHGPIRSPSLNSYLLNSNLYNSPKQAEQSRFIVYLEPNKRSKLYQSILRYYRLSHLHFGANEAHLYHPHCSMTGFIPVDLLQAQDLINSITATLKSHLESNSSKALPQINGIQLLSTRRKLNLAIEAPLHLHRLVENIVNNCSSIVRVRPKPLNHISLAYLNKHVPTAQTFDDIELQALERLAHAQIDLSEVESGELKWDVAFYEQSYQSKHLYEPHHFKELFRFNLS